MGFDDSKQSWGEYGQQVLVSLKNTGDSVKNMLTTPSSGTTALDGSQSDTSTSDVEDASTRARRERKERRLKKKRGEHSSLPSSELDDTDL
jgi:hypothetical protein